MTLPHEHDMDGIESREAWSWPPRYDNTYQPPSGSPYWFTRRETMSSDERDQLILARLQVLVAYAFDRSSFYRRKWSAAGFEVGDLDSLEAFERMPVVTKDELRADQAENEPFGSYLCVSESDVRHVHGTSGTTGRPTAFGIDERDWTSIANAHARAMWAMGIRPNDTVFIGSFFSLYMGSWGALIGAQRLGARVFPFGAGVPGQTLRAVRWMEQMRPTVFYGTPSYALRVAEVAREADIDPKDLGLRILFFSGEPGASVPPIRRAIEEEFGGLVFDSGSMAEVSPWMGLSESSARNGMLCWQDLVYTEVCDPAEYRRVPFGSEGTPIYTTLERTSQPMIRLLSNDLTRWEAGPSPCGRTYPILPDGILGRIDDMFTVRGENIYPSAIDAVVMGSEGYGGEHRILVRREQVMDDLTVEVEMDDHLATASDSAIRQWANGIAASLQAALGVKCVVEPLAPRTLERTEFKARRVVDERAGLTARARS